MIDSHCHLTDPNLLSQLAAVLDRARAAGVSRMVTIGTTADDWPAAMALCRGRPNLRCALGIHPNYSHEADLRQLDELRRLQSDPCVVALGEMGLDYHHHFAAKPMQMSFFEKQLQMATDLDRPVVIHCREATDDCLAVMGNFPRVQAVFHCFTGSIDEAKKILGAGHLMGFTGAATFKKNEHLREAARLPADDRLLIETDSPYLSPEPLRKQRINEPALVVHVAATIAAARGVSIERIDEITTENAMRFYRWKG